MKPALIETRSNPLVRKFCEVRDGKVNGLFIEGETLLREAFVSKLKIKQLVCLPELEKKLQALRVEFSSAHVPLSFFKADVLTYAADSETPQGILALADPFPETGLPDEGSSWKKEFIVVAAGIQHPQNLGNLFRSCEASGVEELWTIKGTVDPYSPKVIRGSAGSAFRLPVRSRLDWNDVAVFLSKNKIVSVAAHQNGKISYDHFKWTQPAALFLGSEGKGFSSDQLKSISETIMIPMKGKVESLNVGTAAAVCLFEAARQKRGS